VPHSRFARLARCPQGLRHSLNDCALRQLTLSTFAGRENLIKLIGNRQKSKIDGWYIGFMLVLKWNLKMNATELNPPRSTSIAVLKLAPRVDKEKWKKTRLQCSRMPSRVMERKYSNDRIPTLDEIRAITNYPDRRIKAIVYTMISSGIRIWG